MCKWKRRNFLKEEVVLLKTDSSQNHWPIARITETFADKYGIAGTVKLRLGDAVGVVEVVESDSLTENE